MCFKTKDFYGLLCVFFGFVNIYIPICIYIYILMGYYSIVITMSIKVLTNKYTNVYM